MTNHSKPVQATKVADENALFDDAAGPGSYCFENDTIKFVCPCGCGQISVLHVSVDGTPKMGSPSWKWDGSADAPTLEPSIRQLGGCRFHGFLQHGTWTFCGDSGR